MTPNASQLSAMTRLFSSAVFREMAKKGRSTLFASLFTQSNIERICESSGTVGNAFDSAFGVLKTAGLRDEYVYRAALTHRVLLGTHSLNTACMLSEFRVGTSKADLAILNGTATAYEIKSERDSLSRLSAQTENYKKVFARVYVIASERHLDKVIDHTDEDVGVMCLSRNFNISTVRQSPECPERICPIMAFESLRSAEARMILVELGLPTPDVPNTQLRAALRKCFEGIEPRKLHVAMVKTLKRSRNMRPLSELVDRLPESLHAAALSIQIRQSDHERLVDAINTPLKTSMSWS